MIYLLIFPLGCGFLGIKDGVFYLSIFNIAPGRESVLSKFLWVKKWVWSSYRNLILPVSSPKRSQKSLSHSSSTELPSFWKALSISAISECRRTRGKDFSDGSDVWSRACQRGGVTLQGCPTDAALGIVYEKMCCPKGCLPATTLGCHVVKTGSQFPYQTLTDPCYREQ